MVALFVCISSAAGLQCMTHSLDYTSSKQSSQSCSGPMCFTATYNGLYVDGNYSVHYSVLEKGCASASLCAAVGSHLLSFEYGRFSDIRNVTCCDTDNCNTADLPFPVRPLSGSMRCYGCDPYRRDCTANLVCNTEETHCLQYTRVTGSGSYPMYGCVSENLCNTGFTAYYLGNNDPVTCCNTTNCNVPPPSFTIVPDSTALAHLKMRITSLGEVSHEELTAVIQQYFTNHFNGVVVRVGNITSQTTASSATAPPTTTRPTTVP